MRSSIWRAGSMHLAERADRRLLLAGSVLALAAALAAGVGLTGAMKASWTGGDSVQSAMPPPAPPGSHPRFTGLNLGAGGFSKAPVRYGISYAYPQPGEADPFIAVGMNAVRVPMLWERLQPIPFGPLDETEMRRLDASLQTLNRFQLIIIDVHNYARWHGTRLDQMPDGARMLADLWTKLAKRYRDPRFAYGIMNEPHDMSAAAWRDIARTTLLAIRRTGARNLVLIPGTDWSAAHRWNDGGADSNAAAFSSFKDPANNMAYEMHVYLDANSSGTGVTCVDPAAAGARLDGATRWLAENHARGFLGEFGVPAEANCLAGLEQMLDRMDRNPAQWLGWTYWVGGKWWKKYPFTIQPDANGDRPQLEALKRHLNIDDGARQKPLS